MEVLFDLDGNDGNDSGDLSLNAIVDDVTKGKRGGPPLTALQIAEMSPRNPTQCDNNGDDHGEDSGDWLDIFRGLIMKMKKKNRSGQREGKSSSQDAGIHGIHYRAYGMQGTYISYADGLRLCNALEFSEAGLDQIKNAIREGWLGPLIHMQHEPKVNFEEVTWKMTAEKTTDEKINVRTHVQVEEFLLSSAKLPSYACSTSDVTTNLRRKGADNDLNNRYYEGLDFEDEEIGFYKYAGSFTKASQACLNNNANIVSNEIEPQQSREHDRQQAAEDSNQEDDEIDNVPCDNEFDRDEFERNRANTHNKVVKKTRKHFSEVHRATLETAYCHNPTLHRTAQAGIAEELGLEKYRVYVCSFNEAYFHMLTTAIR